MVRESGSRIGSTSEISVVRERSWLSPPRPTTVTASPGTMSRGSSFADFTGVVPTSFGSYSIIARLCKGCTYFT